MSGPASAVRLVVAYARHRAAQVLVFALLGFLLAAAVVGPAAIRDSAEVAAAESLRAELGQRTFALQTSDPEVIDHLGRMPEVGPVQDDLGEVTTGEASAPVAVRTTTDAHLRLGVLTRGEHPDEPGELSISEPVAEALGAAIGDTVSVRAGDGETAGLVVGYVRDPAHVADITVIRVVDDSPSFSPTRWLSNADFYAYPELRPALDRRAATYQPVEWLLLGAEANSPQLLNALGYVPAGAGILGGFLLLSVIAALARTWQSDAGTLVAAGLAPHSAWRHILWTSFAAVLVGAIAGSWAVLAGIRLASTEVSAWLGQSWGRVIVPWPEVTLVVGATILAGALSVPVARYLPKLWSWRPRSIGVRRRWLVPVVGSVAVTGLIVWLIALRASFEAVDGPTARLAPIGAAVVVLSAPVLFGALLGLVFPGATRSLYSGLARSIWVTGAIAATVILAAGTWSAQVTRDANLGESLSPLPMPAGSFVISSMPDSAIPALRGLYGDLGGHDVDAFEIPDSTEGNLRVSSPDTLRCVVDSGVSTITEVPQQCYDSPVLAPINTVLLGPPGSAPRAEDGLVADGGVGLIWFSRDTGSIARTETTEAQPGAGLGGNLPGLVVPADGSVAKEFDLEPSGMSEVVLADFHQLAAEDQYALRAGVLRLAPGAEVADATSRSEYDLMRAQADAVSLVGAAGAVLVVLGGGGLAILAQRLTRRTLVDVGFSPARRALLALCWSLVPILSAVLALALAFLTVSAGGRTVDVSFGELWYLPGIAGIVAGGFLWFGFVRAPDPSGP
jgi:transcription elongation GreA/GreB family factor